MGGQPEDYINDTLTAASQAHQTSNSNQTLITMRTIRLIKADSLETLPDIQDVPLEGTENALLYMRKLMNSDNQKIYLFHNKAYVYFVKMNQIHPL
ncbi:hypothetical protein H1P_1820002 [Hyella patelloides LEGE 07179]|uniref:Uncharacterized protein n=1 Tax=Hyella patelloides LEGE 07179 TaxID=945734 RepID=A0A563VNP7_9CYAN|nr:hypothetical protein [Hyella patelloides]VEP13090.1 hypothetical protein H1P_1820002 [Hyella patelloides LEGE 07179]